jgi:hypothetical protein
MPTGYTADVADGKVTDFRTFALRCARAFGACIMQRDDPMNDLPKPRESSSYAIEALARAHADVALYANMAPNEAEAACRREYADYLASVQQTNATRAIIHQRYMDMLDAVDAWVPPTSEHQALKHFMREQLSESDKWEGEPMEPNEPEATDVWLARKRERAQRDVDCYKKQVAEEEQRVHGANAWIQALYDSLEVTANA